MPTATTTTVTRPRRRISPRTRVMSSSSVCIVGPTVWRHGRSRRPQLLQTILPVGFSVPQLGHFIHCPPVLSCRTQIAESRTQTALPTCIGDYRVLHGMPCYIFCVLLPDLLRPMPLSQFLYTFHWHILASRR